MPVQESQAPFAPFKTPPHAPFKLREPFIKQVEADASLTTIVRGTLRQLNSKARHGPLVSFRLARRFFNDTPALVTRGKIALGMNARWIFTQNRFHPAHRLDDPRVLQFRELPQTSD